MTAVRSLVKALRGETDEKLKEEEEEEPLPVYVDPTLEMNAEQKKEFTR